jgi:CspA family cold shock protein
MFDFFILVFLNERRLISMVNGTVKWFSDLKGVGFISQKNGDDVFVHHSSIRCKGFKTLFAGDKVAFEIEEHQKGFRAANVVKV